MKVKQRRGWTHTAQIVFFPPKMYCLEANLYPQDDEQLDGFWKAASFILFPRLFEVGKHLGITYKHLQFHLRVTSMSGKKKRTMEMSMYSNLWEARASRVRKNM